MKYPYRRDSYKLKHLAKFKTPNESVVVFSNVKLGLRSTSLRHNLNCEDALFEVQSDLVCVIQWPSAMLKIKASLHARN